MIDLYDLAQVRQEHAGKKYLMENGMNQAMFRDGGLDILEELADAWNILNLWVERMEMRGINQDFRRRIRRIESDLIDASMWVNAIRDMLPDEMTRDLIEVERIMPEAVEVEFVTDKGRINNG